MTARIDSQPDVLVITGPTASGKSGLALEAAIRLNGRIISADSMQIYRGCTIGTAKPTREERAAVPHDLIDIREPGELYSVADFVPDAERSIREAIAAGYQPIVCGGTVQYVSALLDALAFPEDASDPELRSRLSQLADEAGNEQMHAELASVDPEAAAGIHPNNRKRVLRALEVYYLTGRTKSWQQARSRRMPKPFRYLTLAPHLERETLYKRINQRCDKMLEDGLLEEAKWIYSLGLDEDSTCLQAIGYKEFIPWIEGKATLETCLEQLKTDTRRYAKRQMSWLRSRTDISWLEMSQTCTKPPLDVLMGRWGDFISQ